MSEYTETHLPETIEDVKLWLKESDKDAFNKHIDLENQRMLKQLENQDESMTSE